MHADKAEGAVRLLCSTVVHGGYSFKCMSRRFPHFLHLFKMLGHLVPLHNSPCFCFEGGVNALFLSAAPQAVQSQSKVSGNAQEKAARGKVDLRSKENCTWIIK